MIISNYIAILVLICLAFVYSYAQRPCSSSCCPLRALGACVCVRLSQAAPGTHVSLYFTTHSTKGKRTTSKLTRVVCSLACLLQRFCEFCPHLINSFVTVCTHSLSFTSVAMGLKLEMKDYVLHLFFVHNPSFPYVSSLPLLSPSCSLV